VQESKVLAFKPQSADVDLNSISICTGSKDFNQLRQALESVLGLYKNKDHDNLRQLREEAINKTTRDYDLGVTAATSTTSAAPRRKSTGTAKPRAKKNKKIDSINNEGEDVKPNKRQKRKRRRRTVAAKLSDHDSDDQEEQDDDNDSDFA
jgi:hypothetical protein